MNPALRRLLVLGAVFSATAAGIGAPVHGHAPDADAGTAHIENDQHSHPAGFVQGDDRLQERGPRLVVRAGSVEAPRVDVAPTAGEAPVPERPAGRDPPPRTSPRAPPA